MTEFILSLVNRARTRRPDFLVVPQNAPTLAPSLAPVVNAWAVEDAFFMGNRPQPKAYSHWLISTLEPIRERRLPILSVDYMTRKAPVEDTAGQCRDASLQPPQLDAHYNIVTRLLVMLARLRLLSQLAKGDIFEPFFGYDDE